MPDKTGPKWGSDIKILMKYRSGFIKYALNCSPTFISVWEIGNNCIQSVLVFGVDQPWTKKQIRSERWGRSTWGRNSSIPSWWRITSGRWRRYNFVETAFYTWMDSVIWCFFKKWANPGLFLFIFVLFTFEFNWQIYSLNYINWKSIDGVLGTRTRGSWMEGADESTELWRHLVLQFSK